MSVPVLSGPSATGGGLVPSLDALRGLPCGAARRTPVTHRERQVLVLAANGNTNSAIGLALGLGEETVKTHMRRVLRKLKVSDRTQAVAVGLRVGLLGLEDVAVPHHYRGRTRVEPSLDGAE
ncbi:helix-turn-helix transcriptional regulator [Streptomyces sp. NPDC059916]|uniref:helix-turn-helix domain-containing protein n=1 Tax=Streptomyces sp. NPDC059916 TaxID=3347001 RepID=UPI003683922A